MAPSQAVERSDQPRRENSAVNRRVERMRPRHSAYNACRASSECDREHAYYILLCAEIKKGRRETSVFVGFLLRALPYVQRLGFYCEMGIYAQNVAADFAQ